MKDIAIVTLQPEEWQQYRKLRLEALKQEPQAYASTYEDNVKDPGEVWGKRLEKSLEGKSQWLLFAKQGNNLIGMVGGFLAGGKDTVEIIAVYVVKEARGQGVSRILMNSIMSKIKQNKSVKKLIVGVNTEQIAALNLYQSLGFTPVMKEKAILGDGKEHEIYHMQKLIN